MTCIVGIAKGGIVMLGGDRAIGNEGVQQTLAQPKVFNVGEFVFGSCGPHSLNTVARYSWAPPAFTTVPDPMEAMARYVIPSLRALFKEHELTNAQGNLEERAHMLIGFCGHLYEVDESFQVFENADGYAAIGSGEAFALGAMYAAGAWQVAADQRMRLLAALKAAEEFCPTVRSPFSFVSTLRSER